MPSNLQNQQNHKKTAIFLEFLGYVHIEKKKGTCYNFTRIKDILE